MTNPMTTLGVSNSGMDAIVNIPQTWHGWLAIWSVDVGIVCIAIAMVLCVFRLIRGPHLADRALAVDTLSIELIGLVILLSIRWRTTWFMDGVLVLSLLGFAGTVAMAQYIARPHLRQARITGMPQGKGA